jgi:outer membrane protein OmpA-like peptidoglycan-associated protein
MNYLSKLSASFMALCLGFIATATAQSSEPVTYSPAIEPGLGYVFKTESGFGAVRARLDIRNVVFKNRMGFYYTLEQNSSTPFGKYVRDLAGVSYSINKSFSVHAGAGLWAQGIITDGIRWGGLRKEVGMTYRVPQFPMTIVLGYSLWAGPTATFGYSIPVDIKRIAPRMSSKGGSRDTMYIIDTTARVREKLEADIKALEENSKVYFDYKSDTINNTEKIKLDELVKYLRENPKYKLEIYGNTDQVGSVEYNQALSQQRATNTRNYLISRGIASNRMKVLPLGKTKAVGTETEIDKAKLRCVEFEIIRK